MSMYCTVDDVRLLMPTNIFRVGDDMRATISVADTERLIEQACEQIDARLSTIYHVPLQPDPNTGRYPAPIRLAAAWLTIALLYQKFFAETGEARDTAPHTDDLAQRANQLLDMIVRGEVRLLHQELRGRRFVRQTLLDAPYAPRISNIPNA